MGLFADVCRQLFFACNAFTTLLTAASEEEKAEPVGGGGEMGGAVAGGSTVASPNGVSGDGGSGGAAVVSFTYYSPNYAAHKLKPGTGPTSGGTAVRMLGTGFMNTGEMTVCVRQRGVERRVPAAFISEFEVRFLAPSFAEEGDAKVSLSLNGQEYEQGTELVFTYHPAAVSCVVC